MESKKEVTVVVNVSRCKTEMQAVKKCGDAVRRAGRSLKAWCTRYPKDHVMTCKLVQKEGFIFTYKVSLRPKLG